MGFTTKDSLNIYNTYKDNTIRVIENNIYRLIDDIVDIGFKRVDEIAISINSDKYNLDRVKACIIYIMKELTFKNGDTYLTKTNAEHNAIISKLKAEGMWYTYDN